MRETQLSDNKVSSGVQDKEKKYIYDLGVWSFLVLFGGEKRNVIFRSDVLNWL